MKKERLEHLKNNIHKLDIDLETGIVKNRATWSNNKKYLCLKLAGTMFMVHQVIAVAGGLDVEGMTINHKDGNKQNNRIDNLEAISNLENIQHAIANGLRDYENRRVGKGKTHYAYKPWLHDESFKQWIRNEYALGSTYKKLHEKYGISIPWIWQTLKAS